MSLYEKRPTMALDVFVAPSASVIGDVILNDAASVWYGAVVRGDMNRVTIGGYTNIQDRAVVHAADATPTGFKANCSVGSWCTIGQGAVLRACTVEDYAVIGAGSVLLEGSLVETRALLEPGSVLPAGARVPSGEVCAHAHAPRARAHPALRRDLSHQLQTLTRPRAAGAQVWGGNPISFVRKLDKDEMADLEKQATAYAKLASEHKEQFLPYGTTYQLRE